MNKGSIRTSVKTFFSSSYYSLILILVVVWFLFNSFTDGLFLSPRNMGTLLLQTAILGSVSVGMLVVMITRSIDLSAGSVIAVLSAIGAVLNVHYHVNPVVVILIVLAASMVIAAWQGFFVAKLAVPAFIVTLSGQLYLKGLSLIISGGEEYAPVSPLINNLSIRWVPQLQASIFLIAIFLIIMFFMVRSNVQSKKLNLAYKSTSRLILSSLPGLVLLAIMLYIVTWKGLPWLVVILIFQAAAIHLLLGFTPFGRHIYAVGANPTAAKLSGVNPKRIIFLAFIIMGVSYFFSSIGMLSRISGFVPGVAPLMELDAVAAAVIGGTSLFGGYGTVIGAILGALLLTSIDNGMFLLNVPTFYQYLAKGLILLLAVVIDVTARKRRG